MSEGVEDDGVRSVAVDQKAVEDKSKAGVI